MGKNIIICCDGTGNEFGQNNTNVVKMYQMAEKNSEQAAYYDCGVGTGGWEYDESTAGWKAKKDGATGYGLQKNVNDAYKYLMGTYDHEAKDRIYLFGFSRGAFTVRSLAGMLHKCGLLRPDLQNMLEYAAKMYNTADNEDVAGEFKATFSRPCPVHFIGVWDTVGSLAMTAGKRFHNADLNDEVKYGFHALALDEIRTKFPAALWTPRSDVEQVWFAGVHSDVGGYYDDTGLSDISLKWMAGKAKEKDMQIDDVLLAELTKGANPLAPQHDSHSGVLWTGMGWRVRRLPKSSCVHSSVRERLGQQCKINDDDEKVKDECMYKPEAKLHNDSAFDADKVKWVD